MDDITIDLINKMCAVVAELATPEDFAALRGGVAVAAIVQATSQVSCRHVKLLTDIRERVVANDEDGVMAATLAINAFLDHEAYLRFSGARNRLVEMLAYFVN